MYYIYLYTIILILIIYDNRLNLDNIIVNKIMKYENIFKNVHPNIVTISGLLMNFYIYYLLYKPNFNLNLLIVCLLYRWLVDILDGAIARKYKKTSKLGNLLDTLSDLIMLFIIINYIQEYYFNISFNIFNSVLLVISIIIIYKYKILESHNNVKNTKKNNIIDYIIEFSVKNTLIIYIGFICFIIYKQY